MKKGLQRFGLFILILSIICTGNVGIAAAQDAEILSDSVISDTQNEEEELYDSISLLQIEDYSSSAVTLSWFSDGNNEGFHIYRKCKFDVEYKKLGTVQNVPYATHYFKDNTFVPGIAFTYKITAYRTDAAGNVMEGQSVLENIQVAIPKTNVSSVSRSGKKATVQWKKVNGVSGYEVFQKKGSGAYKRVAVVSGSSTVKWVSDNVPASQKTSFKVRAFVRYAGNLVRGSFGSVKSVYSDKVQRIIKKFQKLQKQYPTGKYWNHVNRVRYDSTTVTNRPCRHISLDDIRTCNHYNCPNGILGYQCYGFAWKMSDLIYGRSAKIKKHKSFAKSKMGDVIRYSGHSVIITEKHKNYVVVGECNYGNTCMILWGRKVYRAELKNATYSRRYR